MINLLSKIQIRVNEKIYLKNPDGSDLGRSILTESINLIHEHGFENFTFKKLTGRISSTETAIYRYFESKHKVLFYLTSWYWGWLEYQLVFSTANLAMPEEKLAKTISLLTQLENPSHTHPYVNLQKLNRIVIAESARTYLSGNVDKENRDGNFEAYKQIVKRVADIINEINPNYQYTNMLISTVIEGAHLQRYYADHLPSLTDQTDDPDLITLFYKEMVFKALEI